MVPDTILRRWGRCCWGYLESWKECTVTNRECSSICLCFLLPLVFFFFFFPFLHLDRNVVLMHVQEGFFFNLLNFNNELKLQTPIMSTFRWNWFIFKYPGCIATTKPACAFTNLILFWTEKQGWVVFSSDGQISN